MECPTRGDELIVLASLADHQATRASQAVNLTRHNLSIRTIRSGWRTMFEWFGDMPVATVRRGIRPSLIRTVICGWQGRIGGSSWAS